MTYQQAILPLIDDAYRNLFENAEALSEHLDYKASATTRTPLELVVECVTAPTMLAKILRAGRMIEDTPYNLEDAAGSSLGDLPACKGHWEHEKAEVFDAIRAFPEERLEEDVETPWGTFPWRDFIAYLYWNPMWHAGQLSYIQTIHGDTSLHL